MKIVLIGAAGDIGRTIYDALGDRHEIITAGRSSGDVQVDMADFASCVALYDAVGRVDAVVSAAGEVHFGTLTDMTPEQTMVGLRQKLMGQINLVLAGTKHVADAGSFTLTSGILDRDPIQVGVGAATANGGLAGFVTGAAIQMPRGQRINVVSPGLLQVSADQYGAWFPGHDPVSSRRVGLAYAKAVEGTVNGQVIVVD
ncbi:MAG: short chain dehydrogenase [Pseudomonadota bacterium]